MYPLSRTGASPRLATLSHPDSKPHSPPRILASLVALFTLFALAAAPASGQLLQADFDDGTTAPFLDVLDPVPAATTRTPLFGGTLQMTLTALNGSVVTADLASQYIDFVAVVDVIEWAPGLDQNLSIAALTATPQVPPNPPLLDGYVLRLSPDTGVIDVLKVDDTVLIDSDTSAPTTLAADTTDYRLVLSRSGSVITGELLDLKDIPNPVAVVSIIDAAGIPGFDVNGGGFPFLTLAESQTTFAGGDMTVDNLVFAGGAVADTDGDDFADLEDRCVLEPNGPDQLSVQIDSDADGYGNACDPDWNNDGLVNILDWGAMLGIPLDTELTGANLRFDIDGDRRLTLADFATYYSTFTSGSPLPGP